jgi:plastocyanin
MATGDTFFESDGKAVDVNLLYEVDKGQLAVVEGWLGIAGADGASGEQIALIVDDREYQFEVPSTLSVSKGNIVYIEIADITGHDVDSTAYGTSAGAGKIALFKATMDKDANNIVTGIMLAHNALLS